MNARVLSFFRILCDNLLILYLCRSIPDKEMSFYKKIFLIIFAFLPTLLYLFFYRLSFYINIAIRFVSYFLFLYLVKKGNRMRFVYLCLYMICLFTACQNLTLTPSLFRLSGLQYLVSYNNPLNTFFSFLLSLIVKFLFLAAAEKLMPLNFISEAEITGWITNLLVLICGLYIKNILRSFIENSQEANISLDVFSLFLQIFLFCFLVFYEKNRYNTRNREEIALQNSINERYLLNMKKEMESQDIIRGIRHDMKNHLLALQNMPDNNQSNQYIQSMLKELETSLPEVETGNGIIDKLLTQKISENSDILFDISLDLSALKNIEDYDLCTILGNAIDNAIEAVRYINDETPKQIRIRSSLQDDQLYLVIRNPYVNRPQYKDGTITTIKENKKEHGYGLKNIRRCVKKYHGMTDVHINEDNFTLSIMLPIQEEKDPLQS